ncbi:MAG TPA: MFS transporter [Croceibacterium sp.]|jgi:AAHS family 4-hydroxybenzoate transporter-like MFS transporter|nr:MFS transporter [Croceibacterium sp.]
MVADAEPRTLDVTQFFENTGFTRFHVWLLVISSFVTLFDGLDFSLISFTIPYLRDELHLTDAMMGNVTAAAFVGQMVGSLYGSYVADIYGRRPVIIWCTIAGAAFTFVTGFASSAEMIIVLRLLGGLAIGGLLAPAWSLNIESMPSGMKATAVTIIMLGFSIGGAAAGQVTNLLAPDHGWQAVFFACGVGTMALALILLFTLPESARWMVARGREPAVVMPILSRFNPGLEIDRYTDIVLSDENRFAFDDTHDASFIKRSTMNFLRTMGQLFRGTLAFITPVIWFTYFCSSFAIYMRVSFGVIFLEQLGVDRIEGTNIGSFGGLVGAVGAVILLKFTEKRGPLWIALAPLLGVPAMLAVGFGLTSGPMFIPVVVLGTIFVGIGHAAVISITTIYYPSAVRSTGGGWASFVAKIAAVAAPLVGAAWFIHDRAAVLNGYAFTGYCLAGVVVGIVALAFYARRLHAERELETTEPVVA